MTYPLNGCMCQDGTCESCNRVSEAWEVMREALLFAAETLATMTTDVYSKGGDKVLRDLLKVALALADKAAKGKP